MDKGFVEWVNGTHINHLRQLDVRLLWLDITELKLDGKLFRALSFYWPEHTELIIAELTLIENLDPVSNRCTSRVKFLVFTADQL